MNYIEFEIGGKLRGFKFGTRCLQYVLSDLDCSIAELGEEMDKNPFKVRPYILFNAHKFNVQKKGQPVTFDIDDVFDWIDEVENGISNVNILECMRLFVESIRGHLPKVEGEEPVEEKKN